MKAHPSPSPSRIRRRSGFTLLEMVIVLAIIAVIMGAAIGVLGKVGDGAKLQRVDGDFNALTAALSVYKINAGTFPSTQQGLRALVEKPTSTPVPRRWTSFGKKIPKDPWDQEYGYKYPGTKDPTTFELISGGPDLKPNTQDDLSSQDD